MQARSSAVPRNASPKAFPAARSFAAAAIEFAPARAGGRPHLPPRSALACCHRPRCLNEPLGRSRAVARLRPASPAARLVDLADDAALRLPRPSRQRRPDELHASRRPARRRLGSCGARRRRRPDRLSGVRSSRRRRAGRSLGRSGSRRSTSASPSPELSVSSPSPRACATCCTSRRKPIERSSKPSSAPRAIRSDMPIGWAWTRLERTLTP